MRNDIASFKGARLVVASEAEKGHSLNETLIKQITGGEAVTSRYLFNEYFEYRPEYKIVLVTNHLPRIQERNEAIWRRIRFIPFNVVIPSDKRDHNLLKKLKRERPRRIKLGN